MKTINSKAKKRGFTLIELVIVIVVLGIIAAAAIPRYVDFTTSATTATKKGLSGNGKSAFVIGIGDLKAFPTVTQLAGYMIDGTAAATGIEVDIDGSTNTIPTYTDTSCSVATSAVGDTVQCVGEIP